MSMNTTSLQDEQTVNNCGEECETIKLKIDEQNKLIDNINVTN